jgi:hypothetical protein
MSMRQPLPKAALYQESGHKRLPEKYCYFLRPAMNASTDIAAMVIV